MEQFTLRLAAADYLSVQGWQDSGGPLAAKGGATLTSFVVTRLGA